MNRFLVSFSVLKLKSQILPNQPTNIYIYNLTAYKLFVITGARGQGPEPLTLENFQKFKIHIVKVQSPSPSHAPPPKSPTFTKNNLEPRMFTQLANKTFPIQCNPYHLFLIDRWDVSTDNRYTPGNRLCF